jgi:hypothetical protein
MATRGGMAKNPFGGRPRLDRLDLMECLEQNAPQEKVLFLQTITDAIHNYLFSFLGRNGTTAEEFAFACQYLFHVRSTDPSTWSEEVKNSDLTPAQIRDMCFDTHYEFSGLSSLMSMDRFLKQLKETRQNIIEENQSQIFEYLGKLYSKACEEAYNGHQLPLPLQDRIQILTQPADPREVASLLYLPPKYLVAPVVQPPRRCRTRLTEVSSEVPASSGRIHRCRGASN